MFRNTTPQKSGFAHIALFGLCVILFICYWIYANWGLVSTKYLSSTASQPNPHPDRLYQSSNQNNGLDTIERFGFEEKKNEEQDKIKTMLNFPK